MFPYLGMMAVPGLFALTALRRSQVILLLVALLYWVMVGLRFQVGMDWNNYIFIYAADTVHPFRHSVGFNRELGYTALEWFAATSGGGIILINAVAAAVFCWGFFLVAKSCYEPWLAITVATPLLVVVFAMSGARQSIAFGIIAYLFVTWDKRTPRTRAGLVLLAALFHFSSIFMLAFVALTSRAQPVVKFATAAVLAIGVLAINRFNPDPMAHYSRLYVGNQMNAPGAIIEVGLVSIAGVLYLINRRRWAEWIGYSPLIQNLAWGSLGLLLVIPISSVGAYRFALYFWPMAMYVYSGYPGLITSPTGRAFYRVTVVFGSFGMMIGWLLFANNSLAWLPYKNWLAQPADSAFVRKASVVRY